MNILYLVHYDDEGDEHVLEMPAVWVVCPDCEGHGSVLNPSMRHHAYTEEEFRHFSADERHAYFTRGGMYDVQCPTCRGRTTVKVVKEDALTETQRAAYKAHQKREAEAAADARADAFTRRMESGGCE
jgi:hypothetical protein